MKNKLSIVFIIAFVLVAVSIFTWIFFKNKSITDLYKAYSVQPDVQNVSDRSWLDIDLLLEHSDSTSLVSPAFLTSINDGFFYVADMGDFTIKKIDETGNIAQKFGKGEGRGPGEFLSVRSLHVNKKGQVWIADERNGAVTIFEQDGTWHIHHPRTMSSGVVSLDSDNYVLRSRFNSQLYINSLNDSTSNLTSPLLNEEGSLWASVMQPLVIKADSSKFLRINMHTNDFVKYNRMGEIIYFRKNINNLDLNDLNIDPPKRYLDDQDIQFNEVSDYSYTPRSIDAQILDQQIHILTSFFNKQTEIVNIVDIYDVETGDYKFSYQLPESLYGFAISNNFIAGITREEQTLKIWSSNNSMRRDHEEFEL